MKSRLLTALVIVCLSSAAFAIKVLENAFEVEGDYVQLPGSAAGSVIFRECATCDPVTLRVSARTEYEIDGQPATLAQLRDQFEIAMPDGNVVIVIFSDVETDFVTRISMDRVIDNRPDKRN